jgi:hypothetical protein
MATGAFAAQAITYIQAGATSAIPLSVTMLIWSAIALAAYYALLHRRSN